MHEHEAFSCRKRVPLVALTKQADPATDSQRRLEALKALMAAGVGGIGLGAVARSMLGIRNAVGNDPTDIAYTSSVPVTVPIHIPAPEEEAQPLALPPVPRKPRLKLAALAQSLVKLAAGASPLQPVADAVIPTPSTSNPSMTALGIPAAVGIGAAGTIGGWHLVDWLLGQQKQRTVDDDLEDAKNEYHKTIADQYRNTLLNKHADSPFPELDELYEKVAAYREKRAGLEEVAQSGNDLAHLGGGMYLTGVGTAALGAGYLAHQWAKGRSQQKLMEKAIALRARMRTAPQPIYAVPQDPEQFRKFGAVEENNAA